MKSLLTDYQALRTLLKESLLFFCVFASKRAWKPAEHLKFLVKQIEVFLESDKLGLVLSTPPRHGKSSLCSFLLPVWYLCRNPKGNVMVVSYEATVAEYWGRKARDLFQNIGGIFGYKLDPSSSAVNFWRIQGYEGSYTAVGAGGGITGKGANLLIVDDPVKNAEESFSETKRNKIWDWFVSTALPRLEPNGKLIVIMTRWHHDDLAGRILKEIPNVLQINLPAIAEENDPLGRQVGQPLWEERFPLKKLEEIKKAIGSYWFSALYQGAPAPREGAIFRKEWIRYYTQIPENFDEIIISWDMAFKKTVSGSYVCGQVWGRKGAYYYLLDLVRGHWSFTETLQYVVMLAEKYPTYSKIIIEEKANGPAIIDIFKKEIPKIFPYNPKESKEARANAVAPLWEAGNVLLPATKEKWVEDFIYEILAFPLGMYDDQVDAMTQALLNFKKVKPIEIVDIAKTSFWR